MFASDIETSVEELSPYRFRVRSFIDYQGKSGLPVRTNYDCVIHSKGKDIWEVEEMKLE